MKLGIITDIHEDILGLHKALKSLESMNCDLLICLGDIVGYDKNYYNFEKSRNANACVKIISERFNIVVCGNHDRYSIGKQSVAPIDMSLWDYTGELDSNLNDFSKNYLSSLPEYMVMNFAGLKILFSHFVFPNVTGSYRYMPSSMEAMRIHYDFMKCNNAIISFCGHSHTHNVLVGREKGFHSFLGLPFFEERKRKVKLHNEFCQCLSLLPLVNCYKKYSEDSNDSLGIQNNYIRGFATFDTESLELVLFTIN